MNKEQILQSKCTQWFNNTYLKFNKCLFAVNNNAINATQGAMLRAIGVRAGVSDLILIAPKGITHYIELKTETGKQSPDQIEFQRQITYLGHHYTIIRTIEDFQQFVISNFNP